MQLWLKDVAPSTELRKWFGHDPARWKEFQARYRKELGAKQDGTLTAIDLRSVGNVGALGSWFSSIARPIVLPTIAAAMGARAMPTSFTKGAPSASPLKI